MIELSSFAWILVPLLFKTFVSCTSSPYPRDGLPIIDLGYTRHQAYSLVEGYFNFTNNRFGLPPTRRDRFKAPLAPTYTDETATNGGSKNIICPQATPTWTADVPPRLTLSEQAIAESNRILYEEVLAGVVTANSSRSASNTEKSSASLDETEDCLFLDLVVPETVPKNRENAKKAPVIVWAYGGGYVLGSKRDTGFRSLSANYPAGLIERSIESTGEAGKAIEPTIVVSPNYRLGLFGWLGGKKVEENGTLNAGLLDQRLALEWVKKHIERVRGDPTTRDRHGRECWRR